MDPAIRKPILPFHPMSPIVFMVPYASLNPRMKPTRIRMCHSLVMNYGLYKKMEIYVSLKGP